MNIEGKKCTQKSNSNCWQNSTGRKKKKTATAWKDRKNQK